jgi:hypothetical protein
MFAKNAIKLLKPPVMSSKHKRQNNESLNQLKDTWEATDNVLKIPDGAFAPNVY